MRFKQMFSNKTIFYSIRQFYNNNLSSKKRINYYNYRNNKLQNENFYLEIINIDFLLSLQKKIVFV